MIQAWIFNTNIDFQPWWLINLIDIAGILVGGTLMSSFFISDIQYRKGYISRDDRIASGVFGRVLGIAWIPALAIWLGYKLGYKVMGRIFRNWNRLIDRTAERQLAKRKGEIPPRVRRLPSLKDRRAA